MRFNTLILSLSTISFFMSCSNSSELSENDVTNIALLEESYVKGWFAENQQDAVLNPFEDNAVFIPHHGDPPVIGKENLRKFFWPAGINGIVHDFNHMPDSIDGTNEVAWIRGRFDLKYSWIIEKDTTTTLNEGNYVMIVRKNNDKEWKIAAFIFNDPIAQIEQ